MIQKIHSKYLLQELFSFISENKILKLIKINSYLIHKTDFSIDDYKLLFFSKKIEKYDWFYVKDYYIEFDKDFKSIIQNEKEFNELFYNCLSKNNNFDLNILDNNFDSMINNSYFKNRIRINLEGINIKDLFKNYISKLILFKDNKFIDKVTKIFKEPFNLFSTNGRMNKNQFREFMISIMNMSENDENIDNLFSKYSNNELLSFEDFINYYLNSITNKIDNVGNYLSSLGYNNLLEKNKEIDFNNILNYSKEFEKSSYSNIIKISKEKIFKLSFFMSIDKIFLQYLNNNQIFENIK